MAAKKPKNKQKKYVQALKANRYAQRSTKSNSPSGSTRSATAMKSLKKIQKKFEPSMFESFKGIPSMPSATKTVKARNKAEIKFDSQMKAEDKDMARRRRLMNAKKNVNKRAR